MKRIHILTLCSVFLALAIFFLKKRNPSTIEEGEGLIIRKEWLQQNKTPITAKNDCRSADQTFLTFPEWYLVFSPEEQADYFKKNTATTFPFMSHTAQIWESYRIVNNQIKDIFPSNTGYHFMIWVIGSSASVEYSIKAWYETIIGRITDTHITKTDEDKFNAKFTQDYVDFIKDRPWYEFDFKSRLTSLWTSTSIFDNNFLRKLDRKYILSSELIAKSIYGKLIGLGTKTVYEEALPTTIVITSDSATLNLPRYDKFNQAIVQLAIRGIQFKEIAGNTSAILLSILAPIKDNNRFSNAQIIFVQPISSNPKMKRVVLATPVAQLNSLLMQIDRDNIKVEHVFDY